MNGMNFNVTDNSTFFLYCQFNPEDPICWYETLPPPFKLTSGKVISAIAIAILMLVALCGNILVCTAFFVYRRLRKTTNYFIISLALSDILVATVAMPMWLSFEVSGWATLPIWIDPHTLLRFWNWFDIFAGVSSITNLTAISIDRCLSIMTPLLHRTRMTSSIAIIMVLISWCYSIILASMSFANLLHYTAIVATLGFFLPLIVIVLSYVIIYVRVKFGGYNASPEKDWNLERTLIIVISVFLICWLPFFIFTLIYHYCFSCELRADHVPYLISFIKWMHYLNSCCNPFIYGLFNLNFKNAFRALIRHCIVLRHNDNEVTTQAVDDQKTTLKCHIIGIKRKLKLKKQARGGSLLLSDVDTGSLCVTVIPGNTSNRSSRSLMQGELQDTWNFNEVNSNVPTKYDQKRKMNGNAFPKNESADVILRESNDDDLTKMAGFYDSSSDPERNHFLQSHESQESCV